MRFLQWICDICYLTIRKKCLEFVAGFGIGGARLQKLIINSIHLKKSKAYERKKKSVVPPL